MVLRLKHITLNETGSKLLIISGKSRILIYDTNLYNLDFLCDCKKKTLGKIKDIILFTEKLILFRGHNTDYFIFNFFSKKFILSFFIKNHYNIDVFSLFRANLMFLKKKKNFYVFSLIFFAKLYIHLIAKKYAKCLVGEKMFLMTLKGSKTSMIKREMRKKTKNFQEKTVSFSYPFFCEEFSANLYTFWDLSTRRKIYEIWSLNLIQKLQIFKFSIENLLSKKKFGTDGFIRKEKERSEFLPDYISNFFFFTNEGIVKKKAKKLFKKFIKRQPFFFKFYRKSNVCNGVLVWEKKLAENWDLFNTFFKEIDCSWKVKKNSNFLISNFWKFWKLFLNKFKLLKN